MTRLLNLGCGTTHHPEWTNVDASPSDPAVIAWDIRRGLPFEDLSFDAAYGSHVLEHLDPQAGTRLLRECRRVLKPGGILRIAVPDLETIARLYLENLSHALAGDIQAQWKYDWMMLELYDQAVRNRSGGAMGACLDSAMSEAQRTFVVGRIGEDAFAQPRHGRSGVLRRLALGFLRARTAAAGAAASLFLGRQGWDALHDGFFRRSGEAHEWMYDRFSLGRALAAAGFAEVRVCAADDSAIPDFPRYGLERKDGRERKPDSLYVEARKPGRA